MCIAKQFGLFVSAVAKYRAIRRDPSCLASATPWLSGLLSSLEVRLAEAAGNRLDHGEFLELILQDELAVRSSRQVERRVKSAMFRETKNLDEFDYVQRDVM
jgi:hypothetical protein